MLLASHNMGEVERMCDDVIMLRPGSVVDQGSPAQLIERYGRDTMEEVFLDIARGVDEPATRAARRSARARDADVAGDRCARRRPRSAASRRRCGASVR